MIGGGLSGLAAAHRLDRLGFETLVVEARGRLGGRAWRVPLGEEHEFDAGCEVLDEGHMALRALLAELELRTSSGPAWEPGRPPLDGDDLALFEALEGEIERLAARVDPLHPEEIDGAAALDLETLGGWLVRHGASEQLLAVAEAWYAVASASVPIAAMSLLAFAAKRAAGAARHGLRLRVEGGPSAAAERLAAALGERVRLDTRAAAVEQDSAGVAVAVGGGRKLRGECVVVAVPLTLQRELQLVPPLAGDRRLALARARYGNVVKAGFVFAEPFWHGLRPLPAVTERGVVYEPYPGQPVLGVFCGSAPARGSGERELLRTISLALQTEAPAPRALVAVDWAAERFTRGSYLVFGPGDLTAWGRRLGEPHGRVHFAGSEASALPSYLEGAVQAAERVAEEIAAAS